MKTIYLDNAATTRLDSVVFDEMKPFFQEKYGNPGSMHGLGIIAKNVVDSARKRVAKILNCSNEEIIFTGSGTESDNLAILGYVRKNKHKGNHIITSSIEHHAVLNSFERLKKEGFEVTILDVDSDGIVNPEKLRNALTSKTILVSIIYANNEIGTIQDIKSLVKICSEKNIVFHTDACQATNYCEIDVTKLGIDLMTLNGSKIYGPKGIGVLYKKKGISIEPIIYGGEQEFNLRAGTENVANIVGFAKALEEVFKDKDKEIKRLTILRDYLINELLKIDESKLNGHKTKRLPNNINISFLNIEGESLILLLNEDGICVSTGSACTSSSLKPSHVIIALGLPHELGHSSIRFTMGKDTIKEDLDFVIKKVEVYVKKLRSISPLKNKIKNMTNGGDK